MRNHLEQNNIFTSLNGGFRSGFSQESQLITTLQDLCGRQDSNTQADHDTAILNLSRVFDTLPYSKPVYKLHKQSWDGWKPA